MSSRWLSSALWALCAWAVLGHGAAFGAVVAHWALDEAADTSGAGSVVDATTVHNGTPSGGVTFGLSGAESHTDTAAEFDGVDGVIDVPYSPALNPQSFTLTAWALPDTAAGGFNSVVTNREDLFPDLGGFVLYNSSAGDWEFWTGPGPGAAGWDVLTGPPVLTGLWQHLAVSYDAATGMKSLYVDGILEASAPGEYSPNASRDLHIGAGGDLGTEFRFDGLIDDVALFNEALTEEEIIDVMDNGVMASGPQSLALEIDRETGNVRLFNPTLAVDFEFSGYSLLSDAGGLNSAGWLSIADNYDADSGGEVDPANNWNVITAGAGELSEGTLGTATLSPGASIDLGNAWLQSPIEDVATEIALADGSVVSPILSFVGNDGAAYETADLNFDGAVDAADWPIYRDGYRSDLSSLTTVEAYRMGDLNLDGENDVTDFGIFKAAYEAANGAGSFAALTAGVPEPAAWLLAALAASMLIGRRLVRKCPRRCVAAVLLMAVPASVRADLPSLVAHWPLDTDATDVVGGHDGAATDVFFEVSGANENTGMAADFVGTSTIEVPYSPELNPESFTVSLWANPLVAGGGAYRSPITSRDDQFPDPGTGDTYGYIIYNNNNGDWSFWTGAGEGNGLWDALDAEPVAEFEWTHLAISFDAGSQTKAFYINGALAAQSSTQTYGPNGTIEQKNLHIGSGSDFGDNFFFDGSIDDVAIFDGALTEAEVQNIMENGAAAFDLLRLKLEINTNSGAATLSNAAGMDQEIDHYEILSAGGALNAGGWTSLEDQDFEGSGGSSGTGDGWEELGAPNSGFLGEGFLQGSSVLAPDDVVELGSLYNPAAGAEDLVFSYRLASGVVIEGIVDYFEGPGGVLGDYNANGRVEQADLDLVLLNWGASFESLPAEWINERPATGIVDQAELDGVLLNWGNGSAGGAVGAVPEPATLLMAALLCAAAATSCRLRPM